MSTPDPPYWRVQMIGPSADSVGVLLRLPELSIVKDKDDVFLVSREFESLDGASAIHERARELLPIVNGAGVLEFEHFKPFALGAVYRVEPDGKESVFITVQGVLAIGVAGKIAGVGVLRDTDGNIKHSEPPERILTKAVRYGRQNGDFAFVLRLLNEPTWHNLYKVHERMESVLDKKYLSTIERTKPELGLFTQTANSGPRHDVKARGFRPHANPMSHKEAIEFIRANVTRWLATLP